MKELENKIKKLELKIQKIEERNKKVELDKAWETSTFRKISITLITYLFMIVIMYFLGAEKPFLDALIPTFWYILSTLWINILKKIYIVNLNNNAKNL